MKSILDVIIATSTLIIYTKSANSSTYDNYCRILKSSGNIMYDLRFIIYSLIALSMFDIYIYIFISISFSTNQCNFDLLKCLHTSFKHFTRASNCISVNEKCKSNRCYEMSD